MLVKVNFLLSCSCNSFIGSLCQAESFAYFVKSYLILVAYDRELVLICWQLFKQLVQFLLKQAGVDKRTGDLYGNRDFLNIARNMARGLKVCSKAFIIC